MFEFHKKINRFKIKLGYRLGLSKAISMPKLITVEPTNHCDLKCPLCPTGIGDKSVEYGLLRLEKFKKVIDIFGKWAQTIQLFSWGEPTLNKSFIEMIRYASQDPYKIRSSTSVNLNNVTDEQIKGLLTSNLDLLTISIDGITQEIYEKYLKKREFLFSVIQELIIWFKNNNVNYEYIGFTDRRMLIRII